MAEQFELVISSPENEISIIIAVIVVLLLITSQVIVKPHNTNTSYSPQTITNDIQEGAVLVDVRTPDEYKIEHAVGSINVPLQDMQNGSFGNLQQDQKIYIYCSSGSRSSQASDLLKQAGYTNVVDIKTLSSWKSLGGDVE